ncbi:MAG: FecR family protein [Bacteroidia bacterium]
MNKEELIIGFLTGSLSEDDKASVESFLAKDSEFKNLYDSYKTIWDNSNFSSNEFDAEKSWENLEKSINKVHISTPKIKHLKSFLRVAAVAIFMLSSVIVYRQYFGRHTQFISGVELMNNQNAALNGLSDGSQVYLAHNSALRLDRKFNEQARKTQLDGEAFFVVKPDKDRPFEVATSHLTVVVKGTSFLINSTEESTIITVKTGVVEVSANHQKYTLRVGEGLIADKNGVKKVAIDENAITDLKKSITGFYDLPLTDILKSLKANQNISITANEPLENQIFTIEFENLTLNHILKTIEVVTNSKAIKKGENYLLK